MQKKIRASSSGFTPTTSQAYGWAFLRLGFRPFYLGAAIFSAMAVMAWIFIHQGFVLWVPPFTPVYWHAHEMLYGFVSAAIIGFLMTASKSWTGLATPRSTHLATLAVLWLAARLAALWGPYWLYAVLDMALLPIVAWILFRILQQSGKKRNVPLVGILFLMALANFMFHAGMIGLPNTSPLMSLHAMLAIVIILECIMAGRVIPAFSVSANPGLNIKPSEYLEKSTLIITALSMLLWVISVPSLNLLTSIALIAAALIHVIQQIRWAPLLSKGKPLLWILQISYAWLSIGLGLLALAQWGWVPGSAGIHSLSVGATGGLVIGMMSRTARGHTGRMIEPSKAEVYAFILIILAAFFRVLMPLIIPSQLNMALMLAASAWSIAFLMYVWRFGPWLFQARVDGKDG